jgi:hypothetical protein
VALLRASVGETGLQDKRLPRIRGEGLPEGVDLLDHLGHGPRPHSLLQNTHVAREVVSGIRVEIRIRRG